MPLGGMVAGGSGGAHGTSDTDRDDRAGGGCGGTRCCVVCAVCHTVLCQCVRNQLGANAQRQLTRGDEARGIPCSEGAPGSGEGEADGERRREVY